MDPLVEANVFKINLGERMRIAIQLFPRNYVTVEAQPAALTEEAPASEAKALPVPDFETKSDEPLSAPGEVSLVLPQRIGLVKAWDFKGTRLHAEFTVLNDTDHLIAIRNVMVLIGGVEIPDPRLSGYVADAAHFKQFVKVNADVRVPSKRRLPVVVRAKSGLWLCAELESPEEVGFGAREHECALFVSLNNGTSVRCRFQVHGDPNWAELISRMSEVAIEEKSAGALGVPITPLI